MLTFVIHLLYEQIKLEQVLDFTKRSYISYLNKLLHSSFRFKQLVISSIKACLRLSHLKNKLSLNIFNKNKNNHQNPIQVQFHYGTFTIGGISGIFTETILSLNPTYSISSTPSTYPY